MRLIDGGDVIGFFAIFQDSVPPDNATCFWSTPSDAVKNDDGVNPVVISAGSTATCSVPVASFETTIVPSSVKRFQPFGTPMWNPS